MFLFWYKPNLYHYIPFRYLSTQYPLSQRRCLPCPVGALCPKGGDHTTLRCAKGFWNVWYQNWTSHRTLVCSLCVEPSLCLGSTLTDPNGINGMLNGSNNGSLNGSLTRAERRNGECKAPHMGPQCMQCLPRYKRQGTTCSACWDPHWTNWIGVVRF